MTFFSDCAGLFTSIFNAVLSLDYFYFLIGSLVIEVSIGLFCFLSRGTRRMA